MKNDNTQIIYELTSEDLQTVSKEILGRRLTKAEIALVRGSVGDFINWFQAIEEAIQKHLPA